MFRIFKKHEQQVVKDIKRENIKCQQFDEAQGKGIVKLNPTFTLNGIEYYEFEDSLNMLHAERYLQILESLRYWQEIGMSKDIQLDYEQEAIEKLEEARMYADDVKECTKLIDEALLSLRIAEEHKKNFNLIGVILEMCSISMINPCENPYKIDFSHNIGKVKSWVEALSTESEQSTELLLFFWKISSLNGSDWMQRLMDSTSFTVKTNPTEEEKTQKIVQENLLILDILKAKELMDEYLAQRSLSKPVRLLRSIYSLAKLKLNGLAYSTIFNIQL